MPLKPIGTEGNLLLFPQSFLHHFSLQVRENLRLRQVKYKYFFLNAAAVNIVVGVNGIRLPMEVLQGRMGLK